MTQIVLVRHGETLWNSEGRIQGHLDSPLTETGLRQAKALAERFKSERFVAVYSSDLSRAYQTAQCISEKNGLPILVETCLRERNFGIFQGFVKKELCMTFPSEFPHYHTHEPDYVIPEGESPRQFLERCVRCLEGIAHKHPGKRVLVVTHGGVLNHLLIYTLGIPLSTPRHFLSLNTAINIFSYQEDKKVWMLEVWGDVAHLQNLEVTDFSEDDG